MSSAPAIGFECRPSRFLQAALLVMALLAALAIALCALPLLAKITAIAAVAVATGFAFRQRLRSPVQAVGCGLDGVWSLRLREVGIEPATLASARVLGGFVLLRLRTSAHGVHAVLLGPDNADADLRRRLRMRLAVRHAAVTTLDS